MTGITWWDVALNLWPLWLVKVAHATVAAGALLLGLGAGASMVRYLRGGD